MSVIRTLTIALAGLVAVVGTAHAQTVKIGTATDLTGLGALIAKAGVAGMEVGIDDPTRRAACSGGRSS